VNTVAFAHRPRRSAAGGAQSHWTDRDPPIDSAVLIGSSWDEPAGEVTVCCTLFADIGFQCAADG
jgi:hypothetical protein